MRGTGFGYGPAVALAALLLPLPGKTEVFVDFGAALSSVESRIADPAGAIQSTSSETGLHLGIGARKAVNDRSDIGIRLEYDTLDSESLLAVRAFDYRRHRSDRLAYGFFAGAARLSLATPAWGYYFGLGVQLREFAADFDLGIDLRYGDNLARDNLLPSDPQGGSSDNFYDIAGISIYLSHRF
jgi:hypothetical protein